MSRTCFALLAVVSLGFAVARLAGVTDQFFKDFAHVWAGVLLGVAVWSRLAVAWWLFGLLSALEVAAAVYSRVILRG